MPALEVDGGQIHQIEAADELHPRDADEIGGEQGGENPEGEPADQAIAERLLVIGPGQPEHHDGHHQRVVGAEEPFEEDEDADGSEVLKFEHRR